MMQLLPTRAKLEQRLPFLSWVPAYRRADLGGDVQAGLTTAVMLIPQAMAYAMLAGLPPIYGLYASVVPLVVYGLLGTSRQLAVGPVAMVSLLVAAGVGAAAEPGSDQFIGYAILLAAMVGVMQLLMGIGRLGFLVNFLSHPVIVGFTSAAALIIGFSQLKHLLGVHIPRSNKVHEILVHAAEKLGEVEVASMAIGALSIVVLVALKRRWPRFPRALAVVVVASLAVWGLSLHSAGVAIVGTVPEGLPAPAVPMWDLDAIRTLFPTALAIALVGFMESISVAKGFARKNRYELDANQELIALGLANIFGSLFRASPVTGGFSRTAVNAQSGSKTGLASIITAAVVALTLMYLTPLFYYLPKAALAAIIMTAVFGLIDLTEVRHLWKVKRGDLGLLGLTFVATLLLGIEEGILVGVGASLLWFVVRTTRPHVAVLGRLPGTEAYRSTARYPHAQTVPGVLTVRIDAQFYFGNVTFLKEWLKRLEGELGEPLRAVVVDCSGMNQIDSSAETALREIHGDYEHRGVSFHMAQIKGPVRDVLAKSGFLDVLGPERLHLSTHDAVVSASSPGPAQPQEMSHDASGAIPVPVQTPAPRLAVAR